MANTARAILVIDPDYAWPQQLRPHEAERLHSMPPGCTAGGGASWKQRLEGIGNGWDQAVILKFYKHSRLARMNCMPEMVPTLLCLSEQDQMTGAALLEMLNTQGPRITAKALSQYT